MSLSTELFNKLLEESLQEENLIVKQNDTEMECCLITGEALLDKHITLSCNHKFNYNALTNEMIQWKSNNNNRYYCRKNKINFKTQTICPYCRTATDGLLPWMSVVNGIEPVKVTNVNWPKKYWILPKKCKYIFASGKRKGELCQSGCFDLFCTKHDQYNYKYDKLGNLKNKFVSKKKSVKKNVANISTQLCQHILMRGKRKGLECGKKSNAYKKNGLTEVYHYCNIHAKKYSNPEPLIKV